MPPRKPPAPSGFLLAAAVALALPAPIEGQAPAPWSPPDTSSSRETAVMIGGKVYTGPFLADTALLARVNDRPIRVREYVTQYFSAVEFRPGIDSTGRVQFLNTMIDKEVMARVARSANISLTFEDRSLLRDHTVRTLSNVLFQRTVLDSIREPSQVEIRRIHDQMRYVLSVQRMLFSDRAQAERARTDLVSGKLSWSAALERFADVILGALGDREPRWFRRTDLGPRSAEVLFVLEPGDISPVIAEDLGYAVYRVAERREIAPPAWEAIRGAIRRDLRSLAADDYRERMLAAMRQRIGLTHDTTNIRWAASRFASTVTTTHGEHGPIIEINETLPDFSPEDTARVLARHVGGALTLGSFLERYGSMPALTRPTVNTAEALRVQVDVLVLEPTTAEVARERGLERDSMAVTMIEKRREELLVDHLYSDSILTRVRVNAAQRRRYYKENTARFMTYPRVRYASFHADTRREADSLAARLRGGLKAEDVLRSDSLAGRRRGTIQERSSEDHGLPHHKLLFEELKPGQTSVQGPDGQGHYDVLQSLMFDPGRQLSFEESLPYIEESLRNVEAEKLLKAFLRRHRHRMRIEAHPELVMQIRLVDSAF